MIEVLKTAKVIVCVGTGGVGKTTLAAALGEALSRHNKRVLVLTIDPAQRLKTTFGLKTAGDWIQVQENLWASVIDSQKTFDDFVRRASDNDPDSLKLFQNNLYKQLTTTLSGSQEFTSLENLLMAVNSGRFDVVVLDTPPAQHAIEFLYAPQKLALIFSEGIARWFRDPGTKKENFWLGLFNAGTKQVLKILERLTGSQFVSELSDFFQKIHKWQGKLEKRAAESHRLLVSPDTHFILVTGFDEAKFEEAEGFAQEIKKSGYHLSGLIVNRAYPEWFLKPSQNPSELEQKFRQYFQDRLKETKSFSDRIGASVQTIAVPEQKSDIHDLEGVKKLSRLIENLSSQKPPEREAL